MSYKRYWMALAIVIMGSFAVLGGALTNSPQLQLSPAKV